jgi:uncharacterized membrane protein
MPLFSVFSFVVMLVLLPILFGELMAASLGKLHLSPGVALLLMIAIIIGGLVNLPVKRIAHERLVPMHPLAVFGLGGLWPEMVRERRETVIAINFGGCLVPTGLAAYDGAHTTRIPGKSRGPPPGRHERRGIWVPAFAGTAGAHGFMPRGSAKPVGD